MNEPSPETLVLVKEWVFYAEEDFRNAEHTLTMAEKLPFQHRLFPRSADNRKIYQGLFDITRHSFCTNA
ncbi:MAG: hypothetical protein ACI8V2_003651 [Candidatus Latescibacterota bacterium]|jgi:hypothetical protein